MTLRLQFLLLSVPLTAAGNLIAARYALEGFTPEEANALRYLLAMAALLPFVGRWPRPVRSDLPWLAATGVLGICVYNVLFFEALRLIPAAEAGLIEMIIPVASLVLAWLILHERVSRRQVVGIAVGWLGIVWLMKILPPNAAAAQSAGDWRGELLMTIAVLIFAVYGVTSKLAMRRLPPPAVAAWGCLFGAVPLVLLAAPGLISHPEHLTAAPLASWLGVLFGGLIGFVYNIIAWYYCFTRIGVSRTNVYLYLVPVLGAALAVPIFGESLSGWQLVGAAVTMGGVVFATAELPARTRLRSGVPARNRE
ncbi:DMT family transporter [Streptantibioticus ferralitis]|uniref:DMT family transporter n=1 Tax=Streptantibioticus ferralitis TaxID=236510 RepID=A0ABT5ZB64_9ACTN|nr:DMT family transporter [Streptantibioticus ferralitis]MDF2261086.1 DMT family transporter [Streptantibioticus ferralitis]